MEIVYDYRKVQKIRNGDTGREVTITEIQQGEFPSCLPAGWNKGLPEVLFDEISHKHRCDCGNHMFYWTRIPEEVWEEETDERVRVTQE